MEPLFKDKVSDTACWRVSHGVSDLTKSTLQIFRDVCCQREILALKVYCRCRASGCQEVMTLQQVPVGYAPTPETSDLCVCL